MYACGSVAEATSAVPYTNDASPRQDTAGPAHRESIAVTAERFVAAYGSTARASISEATLLLSYLDPCDVESFYGFVASLVCEFGVSADLSVEEARALCGTPSNTKERGAVIREFLAQVIAIVSRYGRTAGATAREVKDISKYMSAEQIHAYYAEVERLVSAYVRTPMDVKVLISTVGKEKAEAQLRSGSPYVGELPIPDVSSARRRDALSVLGFDRDAQPTPTEVLHRYRRLALAWHPDKIATHTPDVCNQDAAAKFLEIKAAADLILAS